MKDAKKEKKGGEWEESREARKGSNKGSKV